MTWHFPSYAAAYLVNALFAALFCYFAWRRRSIPGVATFAFLMLAIVAWTSFQALEVMAVETWAKILWAKIEYIGIGSVGILWLLFSARFSNQDEWITGKVLGLLWVIPILTLLVAFTNERHRLLWSSITPGAPGGTDFLVYHHGPWFWVLVSYSYVTLIAGSFLLIRSIIKYPRLYRKQTAPLMLGVAIPWIANIIYVSGYSPVLGMDLSPFSFTIVGFIYLWSVFRTRLFEIVPIARDLLIESITEGVVVLDTTNRVIDLNPAARCFLGVTDACIGKDAESVLGSLPLPLRRPGLRSVQNLELSVDRDTARVFNFDISPLVDRYDRPRGHLIMIRDITEQQNAQEKLRESERRYREHVEEIGDIVYVLDMNRNFKYANSTLAKHIGNTFQDSGQRNFRDIIDPRLYDNPEDLFDKQGSDNEQRSFEVELIGADNEARIFEVNEKDITDGGRIVEIHGIGRDITERKRTEEALRESEEKYRLVVENADEGIIVSQATHMKFVNPLAVRELGYTEEELKIRPFVELIHPDDREMVMRHHMDGLSGKEVPRSITYRIFDRKGNVRWIEVIGSRITWENEPSVLLFVKDISERKTLEQQLIQAEKLSGLGTMISGVAHELNNPLTAIMGNAELMFMNKTLPKRVIKSSEVIFKESERAAKIVSGLLTFAREHKQERKMVDVNDIIRESYKLREYNLKVSNIELRLSLDGDLPPTYADPYQLQQVFTNIINNACDALRDKNGGTLTTRSTGKRDILRIEFEDDGPGIAKKNIKKVFDPFFTTKEVGKGTGLGLSMSYGIIEEHGGKIDVESEQGKGTKFTVSIPVVSGRHEEVETAAHKSTGHTGKRVLVVDDEGSIREMLSLALSMEGYIVETSSSGQEALPLIEAESFDAIIMDMKMPGMEGRQLYAHILNSYPEKAKKILFITGDTLGEDTQAFLEVTGSKCIVKPFRIEVVYRMLDEFLEQ